MPRGYNTYGGALSTHDFDPTEMLGVSEEFRENAASSILHGDAYTPFDELEPVSIMQGVFDNSSGFGASMRQYQDRRR